MKILDATCGAKNMWFNPNHPLVIYLDKRNGKYISWIKRTADRRIVKIKPNIVADWTKKLPFNNDYFDMILFDPPHIIRNKEYNIHSDNQYGILFKNSWKQDLKKGIKELFRVLKPKGIFIFKWGQHSKPINEIIKLFPYPPIFGNKTRGQSVGDKDTIWLVFLKYDVNIKLDKFQT